jgi:hypothetical protein
LRSTTNCRLSRLYILHNVWGTGVFFRHYLGLDRPPSLINLKRVDHDPGLFATPHSDVGNQERALSVQYNTTSPSTCPPPGVTSASGNRRSFQHLRHPRLLRLVSICLCQRLVASSSCPLVIKVCCPSHIVVWEGSVWGSLLRCPATGRLPSDRTCTSWSQVLSSGSLQQVCSL